MRLLPTFACRAIEVFASFPPNRTDVPAVRAFVNMLVDHAAEIVIESSELAVV